MEEEIIKVEQEIVGSEPAEPTKVTPLTESALHIAHVAITSFNGELRERALDIAKAIVDYEDALKRSR